MAAVDLRLERSRVVLPHAVRDCLWTSVRPVQFPGSPIHKGTGAKERAPDQNGATGHRSDGDTWTCATAPGHLLPNDVKWNGSAQQSVHLRTNCRVLWLRASHWRAQTVGQRPPAGQRRRLLGLTAGRYGKPDPPVPGRQCPGGGDSHPHGPTPGRSPPSDLPGLTDVLRP